MRYEVTSGRRVHLVAARQGEAGNLIFRRRHALESSPHGYVEKRGLPPLPHLGARQRAQRDAEQYAEQLNSGVVLTPAEPSERRGAFRPNCPRCSNVCPWYAIYCADCGTRLYPAWSGKYGERT